MNLNISDLKIVLQKLSVIKNNTSLLISIIILVIAALLFVPTYILNNRLTKKIEDESVNMGLKKVKTLSNSIVSNKQADEQDLRVKAVEKDANDIINLTKQSTERELLNYDIFPEPDPNGFSQLVFQEFGQKYRKNLDELISRYNGRDCPSITELQRRLQESMTGINAGMGMQGGRGGIEMSRGASMMGPYGGGEAMVMPGREMMGGRGGMGMDPTMMFGFTGGDNELQQTILDEVCLSRAKNTLIYITPSELSGYDYWANYKYDIVKEDAIQDCWYYQMGYWIIKDLLDTIYSMNSAYENVLTAPVKRFMEINFSISTMNPGSMYGGRGMSMTTDAQNDRPKYVITGRDGLTESCTGRYSNPEDGIDIIHFNIIVVVNAKQVLPFIKELCSVKNHQFRGYPDGNEPTQTFKHNQITVIESTINSIGPNDYLHTFYRYGNDPVVELNLVCEYILNRDGYEIIKPESVKATLSGQEQS